MPYQSILHLLLSFLNSFCQLNSLNWFLLCIQETRNIFRKDKLSFNSDSLFRMFYGKRKILLLTFRMKGSFASRAPFSCKYTAHEVKSYFILPFHLTVCTRLIWDPCVAIERLSFCATLMHDSYIQNNKSSTE